MRIENLVPGVNQSYRQKRNQLNTGVNRSLSALVCPAMLVGYSTTISQSPQLCIWARSFVRRNKTHHSHLTAPSHSVPGLKLYKSDRCSRHRSPLIPFMKASVHSKYLYICKTCICLHSIWNIYLLHLFNFLFRSWQIEWTCNSLKRFSAKMQKL